MESKQYIQPRVTVVAFTVEEGFQASVTRTAVDNSVLFEFHNSNESPSSFRNDRFSTFGGDNNDNYNFFGD